MAFNTTPDQLTSMFDKIMGIDEESLDEFDTKLTLSVRIYHDNPVERLEKMLTHPMARYIDQNTISRDAIIWARCNLLRTLRRHGIIADDHDMLKRAVFGRQGLFGGVSCILNVYPEIQFGFEEVKHIMKFGNQFFLARVLESKNINCINCLKTAVVDSPGDLELITMLCQHCTSEDVTDAKSASVLAFALEHELYYVLEILLTVFSPNATMPDLDYCTPLEYAIYRKNNGHMARLLMKYGAKPSACQIANVVDNLEIIKMFAKAGTDFNVGTICSETPIIKAANRNRQDAIRVMLDNGADINYRTTKSDMTALHAVCGFYRSPDKHAIIKMLLANGARTTILDKKGKTAYDYLHSDEEEIKDLFKEFPSKTPSPPPPPLSKKSPPPAPLCDVPVTMPVPFDEIEQLRKELDSLKMNFNSLMVQFESVEDLIQRLKN